MMYGNAETSPPVNNLLQPDMYNRLDAGVIERTRVANAQLDHRLLAQHRILAKYRLAAERFYRREKNMVQNELSRISNKLPAVSRIKDFRNKFFYGEGAHKSLSNSLPDIRAKKIRGVPEEKPEQPFCQRYFIHHLPTKKKYYRTRTPSPLIFMEKSGEETEESNDVGVSLPPLTVPETPKVQTEDVDKVSSDHHDSQMSKEDDCDVVKGVNSHTKASSDRLSFKSEGVSGDLRGVRIDNCSPPLSSEGRPSHRKLPGKDSGRVTSLPPILQQNLRLAHSSPQLFHG